MSSVRIEQQLGDASLGNVERIRPQVMDLEASDHQRTQPLKGNAKEAQQLPGACELVLIRTLSKPWGGQGCTLPRAEVRSDCY